MECTSSACPCCQMMRRACEDIWHGIVGGTQPRRRTTRRAYFCARSHHQRFSRDDVDRMRSMIFAYDGSKGQIIDDQKVLVVGNHANSLFYAILVKEESLNLGFSEVVHIKPARKSPYRKLFFCSLASRPGGRASFSRLRSQSNVPRMRSNAMILNSKPKRGSVDELKMTPNVPAIGRTQDGQPNTAKPKRRVPPVEQTELVRKRFPLRY